MSIARGSIDRPLLTWMAVLVCLAGGTWGFFSLGRLEDPAFTIKQAVVETRYPGASAQQVADEVSEPLESAIQKMGEVDRIASVNRPGISLIDVHVKSTFDSSELPAIWTELRAKVGDAARRLPPGVGEPVVNDGFGDVFGLYYAVTAEGFSDAEKHRLAGFLRRELLAVEGVADISVRGLPDEAIFVEPEPALAVNLNVAPGAIIGAITDANSVADAGSAGSVRIAAPAGSETLADLAGLSVGVGGEVIRLADIARFGRGRRSDPGLMVRFNGVEAFTLGIAGLATDNIVTVGKRVERRLAELRGDVPVGVEFHPIYRQHRVVEEASNAFLVNLAMSVGIVVTVLALFMGWRAAVVVGATLLLTVVGTFLFMAIFSIEMERISLGGLMIAMGMLVDNAIVVAEGMQVAMLRGRSSRDAAHEAASKTQVPLLGATVIGILAFAGIGLSPEASGEFLFSLFAVIGISLLLSWTLAVTVTPLLGHYFFRRGAAGGKETYGGFVFRAYTAVLSGAIRVRWVVVPTLAALTLASFFGFTQLKQQFFPDSNTPIFFVHYKLPQGASIHRVSEDLAKVDAWLAERQDVVSVATFAGQGGSRFVLTYAGKGPNPSYGHMIVRVRSLGSIPALQADLEAFARKNLPEGEFRTRRLVFGPGGGNPIEVRFSGGDPVVLRELARQAMARMAAASDDLVHPRTNWREPELVITPVYASDRAQTAGISRDDVATALRFADGVEAGVYREGERLIPIVVRLPHGSGLTLGDQVVWSPTARTFVPIEQTIDGFAFEAQDTLVHRRDRVPTLTVAADIPRGKTAAEVHAAIRPAVESVPLPPGYRMEWGGQFEDSAKAQGGLAGQLPLTFIAMVLISILLFNALRQPLIVWLLVPMAVTGVVIGLLGTGLPFTFTALLGLLSLSGMLLKNGIVLVEEIDRVRREGAELKTAITTACASRLRPVVLAAATTILGMSPLLSDAFFVSMAVTIMSGLAFASILTLVAAPILYYLLFARDEPRTPAPERSAA